MTKKRWAGRRALLFAGIAALAPLACRLEQGSPVSPSPSVYVQNSNWEIGTASSNSIYENVFQIVNVSEAPVTIKRIKTTCGCAAAQLAEPVIAPQTARELKVSLHPNGRTGPFRGYVALDTDNDSYPVLTANIHADFLMPDGAVMAFPPTVDFGDIIEGDTATRTVTLVRHGQGALNFADAAVNGGHVEITRKEVMPNQTAAVDLSVLPTIQEGPFDDTLLIKTQERVNGELQLPIHGNCVPAIVVVPSTLLVTPKIGVNATGKLIVSNRKKMPFSVSAVAFTPSDFPGTTSVTKLSDCQYEITYSLPAESIGGFAEGALQLSLAGAATSSLSIPIVAAGPGCLDAFAVSK